MDGIVQTGDEVDAEDAKAADTVTVIDKELRMLEAMLFAATEPVTEASLADRMPEGCDLSALLATLAEQYEGRGINLVHVAERWAFRTAPDLAGTLEIEINVSRKLSRAAVETLAIIAYHQPVTRGDIEEIRGVALSRGTLDVLLEIGWIRPVGRRRTPGRPVTWGTSSEFLDHFNLNQLEDLPGVEEMKASGLLDARPVRTIFGEGAAAGPAKDEEEDRDDPESAEMIEPLDPNDGETEAFVDEDAGEAGKGHVVDLTDSDATEDHEENSVAKRLAG